MPAVISPTDGSCGGPDLVVDSRLDLELAPLPRRPFGGISTAVLVKVNGLPPARRAISCSPSCQCIASAARQGIDISLAISPHIFSFNLAGVSQVKDTTSSAGVGRSACLSYSLANLSFRSSSHSLLLSR